MNPNKMPCASWGTGHTAADSGSGALVSVFSISNYMQIPIRVNGRTDEFVPMDELIAEATQ
jgi:hypothetical protein